MSAPGSSTSVAIDKEAAAVEALAKHPVPTPPLHPRDTGLTPGVISAVSPACWWQEKPSTRQLLCF